MGDRDELPKILAVVKEGFDLVPCEVEDINKLPENVISINGIPIAQYPIHSKKDYSKQPENKTYKKRSRGHKK